MARVDDDIVDEEHIVDIDVTAEMETSFLEYAYSVIYSRALPDARDGLKPVQRRILFSMGEMGVTPDKGHVKCARVVGQVMGSLHPHGDGAIYDALVRLAQPWTMRLPLVDGHGNFGSLDAGPAAMRYTECRMDHPALAMTQSIEENTVNFRPNYDGKESEPEVLPSAIPNLLVNGASGIAVGMATNIAPHNLVEVIGAIRALVRDPDVELDELMRHIPGPDFPTGGKIVGLSGVRDAYATGRGSVKIRATARVEKVGPRRQGIIVTELPYMVGPERIIEQIKKAVGNKKLTGIHDVKDLSDLERGTRLVIEVKNGINPDALLEQLYKQTKLEDSFSTNAVALVDGQPRTLTLKEMLEVYLEHRRQVIDRRTEHRLGKAKDRLHLVEGLMIAILDIDDVIAIIRSSDDVAEARQRLMGAFELTEPQANYILEMQLRRLTKFSTLELEKEAKDLRARIEQLQAILDDPHERDRVLIDELDDIAKAYGTPRRTVLLAGAGTPSAASAPLEIEDVPCRILLSGSGLVARVDAVDLPPASGRAAHDVIVSSCVTTSKGQFGVVTNFGRCIRAEAIELPTVPVSAQAPNLQGGSPVAELWQLDKGERIVGLISLSDDSLGIAVGTRDGVVKRVRPDYLARDSWEVIRLGDGDQVVGAQELVDDQSNLAFITSDGQLLHFAADLVRPQGRTGGGVAGIKLAKGASVIWFGAVHPDDDDVVTVAGSSGSLPGTEQGSAKVTALSEYPTKGRGTGGVRCHRFLKGEDALLVAGIGAAPMMATAASGSPVELPTEHSRRDGSGTPLAQPVVEIAGRLAAQPDQE
ncbi:MAG: DNA topoisomerase IV subunit A [Propionibacteriaceae bacterium]|nr:DNA topoisomerase IV subunit A [Propionibacteriaceae bacterium]